MSQTQTQTLILPSLRLKLPEVNVATLKLPVGLPKVETKTLDLTEIKIPIPDVKTLSLQSQLAIKNNTGLSSISELPTSVDPVTAPPIRPTLQNVGMTEVFNKTVTTFEKAQIVKNMIIEENKLPEFKVTETDLRLFSFEEMKLRSFFEVVNAEDTGIGSINDPRGGIMDDDALCATCKKGPLHCTGHPGLIIFNKPIIHPKGISIIIKIFKCICIDCGELKLTKAELEEARILKKTGANRLDAVLEKAESAVCRHKAGEGEAKCKPNPTFISKMSKEYEMIWTEVKIAGKKHDKPMDVYEVLQTLKSISDEDSELLGFISGSRPENLIMQGMMVIPQISRLPTIRDGEIWPHHLSIMLKDIVAENLKLQKGKEEQKSNKKIKKKAISENDEYDAYNSLIFKVKHFMDNSDKKWTHQPQGVFDSIKDIIQGKEGIINSLLLGKRVNFVGRTVISPDPSLKFGQVRVPKIWESVLTTKVKVFKENKGQILEWYEQGRITHITPGKGPWQGSRIQITEKTKARYTPDIGDEVERFCKNGDVVLFNRQPTIQKEGMMGYEVVLGEGQTIGLHMAACHPHNADMDGDESQIHMLQAIDAIIEAMQVANTRNCIVNAQSNRAMANVPMDAITASYLMSIDDQKEMNRNTYNDAITLITSKDYLPGFEERLNKYNVLPFSTRALISALFSPTFNYSKGGVIIVEGIFIKGIMSKQHWGPTANSIVMEYYFQFGTEKTSALLTDAPYIFNRWFLDNPFSVKYSDCLITDPEYKKKIDSQIENARNLVQAVEDRRAQRMRNEAKMRLPENKIEYEREEDEIKNALNNARNLSARESMASLPKTNSIVVSATAGTKGDAININSITGVLGQQYLRGSRMPKILTGGTRCLPYFAPGDTSIESSGFCTGSFINGLTASELFFTAMAGRESSTNTSLSVPQSGYISKRIVRNLEDLIIKNNGTVANSAGIITGFSYGNEGFAPQMLTYVPTSIGNKLNFMNYKFACDTFNVQYGYAPVNTLSK